MINNPLLALQALLDKHNLTTKESQHIHSPTLPNATNTVKQSSAFIQSISPIESSTSTQSSTPLESSTPQQSSTTLESSNSTQSSALIQSISPLESSTTLESISPLQSNTTLHLKQQEQELQLQSHHVEQRFGPKTNLAEQHDQKHPSHSTTIILLNKTLVEKSLLIDRLLSDNTALNTQLIDTQTNYNELKLKNLLVQQKLKLKESEVIRMKAKINLLEQDEEKDSTYIDGIDDLNNELIGTHEIMVESIEKKEKIKESIESMELDAHGESFEFKNNTCDYLVLPLDSDVKHVSSDSIHSHQKTTRHHPINELKRSRCDDASTKDSSGYIENKNYQSINHTNLCIMEHDSKKRCTFEVAPISDQTNLFNHNQESSIFNSDTSFLEETRMMNNTHQSTKPLINHSIIPTETSTKVNHAIQPRTKINYDFSTSKSTLMIQNDNNNTLTKNAFPSQLKKQDRMDTVTAMTTVEHHKPTSLLANLVENVVGTFVIPSSVQAMQQLLLYGLLYGTPHWESQLDSHLITQLLLKKELIIRGLSGMSERLIGSKEANLIKFFCQIDLVSPGFYQEILEELLRLLWKKEDNQSVIRLYVKMCEGCGDIDRARVLVYDLLRLMKEGITKIPCVHHAWRQVLCPDTPVKSVVMSAIHARLKKFIVAHPSSHHDFRHQLDFLSRMHDNFDDLVLSLIQKAIDTKITQVATTTTETNTTTTTAAITSTATTTTPAINNQEIDDADQQDTLMAIDVLVPALSWSEKYAFFSLIWLYFSEKQKTITCLKVVEMLLRATHTKAQEDQFQWIKNQIKSMFKMSVQEGVGDLVLQAFGTIESICVFGEVGEADKAALKQWYNKQAGKVFVSPILAKRYSFLLNE